MKAIHLIQRDPKLLPWPVKKGTSRYESGYWRLTPERAHELLGSEIYFHVRSLAPSFFGGIINGWRIQPTDPWKGRIIFIFTASPDFWGKTTDRQGWSMVMKFVE